jgi:2-polyprenyl-6-methoxyphenol hydroxylase-like FAD-dependent oxidoreductase
VHRRCILQKRWAAPSPLTPLSSRARIPTQTCSFFSAVGLPDFRKIPITNFIVLDTPGNFETSSKDRYHCQVIVSWADSKGISVPGDNAERIALMKNLTDSWSEPFRSLVHKLPDEAEVRSIRIEDWMFQPGRTHAHPRAVLMGDSAHTMTMCT